MLTYSFNIRQAYLGLFQEEWGESEGGGGGDESMIPQEYDETANTG